MHTLAQPVLTLCARLVVSWLVAGRVPGLAARRVATPPRVSLRVVSQLLRRVAGLPSPYRGSLLSCITAQFHRIATQSLPLSHDTNLFIVTLLLAERTARRITNCLAVSRPSSGRVVACYVVSWRAPARPCALSPSPVS